MTASVVPPEAAAPLPVGGTAPAGVDAHLWLVLLEHVAPMLRTYPSVAAWTPACAAGTTPYAAATLLDVAGLLGRARVYASDADEAALGAARDREPPAGTPEAARARLVWCEHNLATDASLNEFQMVWFDEAIDRLDADTTRRALALARESLCLRGVLVASPGTTSSIDGDGGYERLDPTAPVFRKRA